MKVTIDKLYKKIQTLNFTIWENRAFKEHIDEWLNNFENDQEREYALYILSKMMYYSAANIRHLLKSLYRDKFRYPIIQEIRSMNSDTLDESLIETEFKKELKKTRFLGVGNPSESGVHLLYYFRQENNIPKDLFVNTDDLVYFEKDAHGNVKPCLRDKFKDVKRYIFIDDICGSGTQATSDDSNVRRCVTNLRPLLPDANISYLMLFGLSTGIKKVREFPQNEAVKMYNMVDTVIELDESYKCFGNDSRYFTNVDNFDKDKARDVAYKYGYKLAEFLARQQGFTNPVDIHNVADYRALGFGNNQLLIALHHNTPDNTLPIIWFDEDESIWTPVFKRYNKNYEHI